MNHIPFLDIVTPHLELEEQFIAVLRSALKSGRFIGGPMVEDFERDFARFCDSRFSIGVGSGTDALRFALIAAGVEPSKGLAEALEGAFAEVHNVGDCIDPRHAMDAIHEAARIARQI